MLRLVDDHRLCSGRITRRAWLCAGSLAELASAASFGRFSAAEPSPFRAAGFARAKSVIVVFASRGQSHIYMWDPKPNAPLEVRGAFGPISTALSGVQLCEHMSRIARVADRLTLVRS